MPPEAKAVGRGIVMAVSPGRKLESVRPCDDQSCFKKAFPGGIDACVKGETNEPGPSTPRDLKGQKELPLACLHLANLVLHI